MVKRQGAKSKDPPSYKATARQGWESGNVIGDRRSDAARYRLVASVIGKDETLRTRLMKSATPIGMKSLAVFFAFGACMCALTIWLLLFPGGSLDALWRLNVEAHAAFQRIGGLSILLMAIVGVGCAIAAIGLAKNAKWARWVGILILAVNLVGDLTNAFVRHDLRTLIGVPIAGAMIFYLARFESQVTKKGRR